MEKEIQRKYTSLKDVLGAYSRVAVAFSGGVDSSLLLFTAGKVLGKKQVVGFHGVSCLNSSLDVQGAKNVFNTHCSVLAEYMQIDLYPLQWREFVVNSEERCYFCKKRIYSAFKEVMCQKNYEYLLDGTNKDDLKDHRPGFRAIRELGVHSPLLQVGLNKQEIRIIAKEVGLSNHDLPSNSCLATRIETSTIISDKMLSLVSEAEEFLHDKGYLGSRIQPRDKSIVIAVQNGDFERIVERSQRLSILHYFQSIGFESVAIDLRGRM